VEDFGSVQPADVSGHVIGRFFCSVAQSVATSTRLKLAIIMSSKASPYRDSTDLPQPPPSYEPAVSSAAARAGPSEPLLGSDHGRHSDDDIPDDFKYRSLFRTI
jgi:hypothetical protein